MRTATRSCRCRVTTGCCSTRTSTRSRTGKPARPSTEGADVGDHIVDGQFQSDKYPWCKPGFVPLKLTDPAAQPLLWRYAQLRRAVDAEFADDLESALRTAGYDMAS